MAITGRVKTANGLLNKWPLGPSSLMGRTLDENFEAIDAYMAAGTADPLFSVGSNGIVKAPTQDDVDNNRILKAANGGGEWVADQQATVFSQGVAGIVNGPTADDISNGRIVNASNTWIDAPSGGLSQSGAGTFSATGAGANLGGFCDTGGSLSVTGRGSLMHFDGDNNALVALLSAGGGVLTGGAFGNGDATVTCAGLQSTIHCGVLFPSAGANVQVSADFGHIRGRISGASELKISSDDGYILGGLASGGASVEVTGSSWVFAYANTSGMIIDGARNLVAGDIDGSGTSSTLQVLSPAQPNETTSTLLVGHSSGGGELTVGDAAVQMIGGGLIGSAVDANSVLAATRSGALTSGHAANGGEGRASGVAALVHVYVSGALTQSIASGQGSAIIGDNAIAGGTQLATNQGCLIFGSNGGSAALASGLHAIILGNADAGDMTASGDGSILIASTYSNSAAATGSRSIQIGQASLALDDSVQIGNALTAQDVSGTWRLGFFGTTPVIQQVHVADPTDLASCITAITAINAKDAAYGLTAAA